MNPTPTSQERIWAVLSHLSALAFGMGIALPTVGWSEQRRKSKYASFQCLQAMGYQSLGYTVWLLASLVLVVLLSVVFLFAAGRAGGDSTFTMAWTIAFLAVMFGSLGLYLLLPVIAAVACALGRDFHYPILGKRLARYLGDRPSLATDEPAPFNEEHEERWVAAMGHFSVIIMLWGLVAPVTTWILQGKQNAFLKFQSIQTTLFQLLVNILYLGGVAVIWIGMIPLFALTGLGGINESSPLAMPGLVLFFLAMLVALVLFLVLPLFHILGQWAGYRVLKGHNYRYPLLGRLVERRMNKQNPLVRDGGLREQGESS